MGVIGYFAFGISQAGGQEAKTCSIAQGFENIYGRDKVKKIDTLNWKKNIIKLFMSICNMARTCEKIVMLPAQNSIKIFIPLFLLLNVFYHKKLYYSVVGGWFPKMAEENSKIAFFAQKLNGIFVETISMKEELEALGFENVSVVPNFKYILPISENEIGVDMKKPHKLCMFSRVMEEKGVEDAIQAVKQINEQAGSEIFHLDIYGKIDPSYENKFETIKKALPSYINYCGFVEPNESIAVLKTYFALLFPTKYFTEGVPGTLIDACYAGVPVVCSLWKNHRDVFEENVTGWGFEFCNYDDFVSVLNRVAENPEEFSKMRTSSLRYATKYDPNVIMEKLNKTMEG